MRIEYIRAKNFFCIGEEPIEINFTELGNIVLIKGRNLDLHDEDEWDELECSESGNEYHSNAAGKCFGKGTPILMYDGTIKKVEDIVVGDEVMGNDSSPRKVLKLARGREPLYRVIPNKGDSYVVNESHILTLKTKDKKYNRYSKSKFASKEDSSIFNISVKDYLKQSKTFKHLMGGYRTAVDFPKAPIRIDPYFLGIWLGDGNSTGTIITNIDSVVHEVVKTEAASRNLQVREFKNSKDVPHLAIHSDNLDARPDPPEFFIYNQHLNGACYSEIATKAGKSYPKYCSRYQEEKPSVAAVWRSIDRVRKWLQMEHKATSPKDCFPRNCNSLLKDLKSYQLIDNKHVPLQYKANSRQVRLELLAGLMDSDGHLNGGCFEFVNKNKKLVFDVAYLARSLGFSAYPKECQKKCQTGATGTYWRVHIGGDCSKIPTRVPRKTCQPTSKSKDPLTVGISVQPIGTGNYYGFQTDGNHLFLLADFTVVHNSTIAEMVVYGLYGNTIRKKVKHTDAIHNRTGKKLEVEIIFSIDDVRYRIVRTRQPDTVRLWQGGPPWIDAPAKNNNEDSRGGQIPTQKRIEEILKMNHKAFVNVVCFGQHNEYNFLECDSKEQRAIAENLLSLEVYNDYLETAKKELKATEAELKSLMTAYEQIKESEASCLDRISQVEQQNKAWRANCLKDIETLKGQIEVLKGQIGNTDIGSALLEYEGAQNEIVAIQDGLADKDVKETNMDEALQKTKENHNKVSLKIHELKLSYKSLDREMRDMIKEREKCKGEIAKLNKLPEGAKCPHCYGPINKQHYKHVIKLHNNKIDHLEPKINANEVRKDSIKLEIAKYEGTLAKLAELKRIAGIKLNAIKKSIQNDKSRLEELGGVQRPDLTSTELVLKEKLSQTERSIQAKEDELVDGGPYVEILKQARKDLIEIIEKKEDQDVKVKATEEIIPYYKYAIKVFGPNGIRSYIIEGITPALNARIAYWMEHLMDGRMEVSFDGHLDATIKPIKGKAYSYSVTCGGERKRINLAISQAFAHVMMFSSGTWPSLVFLDEVSDSIDQRGVRSIYQTICELAKEKQVFVVTHNTHLRQMLDGVRTIMVQKQNGFTRRIG